MSLDHLIPAASQSPDSPFISIHGVDVQYAWDSVSLTSILSCPRRYQYSIIQGQVPNSPSFAIALVFGILFHKGMEVYHNFRAAGHDHDEGLFYTVRYMVDYPQTSLLPAQEDIEDMAADQAEDDDGITLRNSKVRTRAHLFRAIVWYLETYKADAFKTYILANGKPAVELSFRTAMDVTMPGGVPILLCGHLDRVVEFNESLGTVDYKTSKSISRQNFEMFDLSHQMSGYFTAGSVILPAPIKQIWIDGIALQVGGVKFGRHPTKRTPGQVNEYLHLLGYAGEQAYRFAQAGYYPMNTASCYFCEYKPICKQAPEFRDRYLSQSFTAKPGWNPLENR